MSSVITQRSSEEAAPVNEDLSLWQVMCSVFAAGFGVQSEENKVRDFTRGKPTQFIIAGLLFTVAFMLLLIGVINIIL